MIEQAAVALADAIRARVPDDVDVVDHPPDTRAPPLVYLDAVPGVRWSAGWQVTFDIRIVVDVALSDASAADQLRALVDQVLAAGAAVGTPAECSVQRGTQAFGEVAHPRATVTVTTFHAACELPTNPPVLLTASR